MAENVTVSNVPCIHAILEHTVAVGGFLQLVAVLPDQDNSSQGHGASCPSMFPTIPEKGIVAFGDLKFLFICKLFGTKLLHSLLNQVQFASVSHSQLLIFPGTD
ncbi:MAG: hypothetical protein K2H47_05500 [Muribaculaceae bacterium]|nr:hypothetical protein [Muribaculaceae bacterium]